MKAFFKSLLWPFVAMVIYLCVQSFCSLPLVFYAAIERKANPEAIANPETLLSGTGFGIVLLVSSIITGALILWMKPFGLRSSFAALGCKRWPAVLAVIATLFGLFASNILNEFLDLPNMLEELFNEMAESVWGLLAIGVFGPIAEEIVFRGGIMKPMLDRGQKPWTAILVSAIVFGLAHGNPVQIPFAALVGVMFGVVYYKTKSLIITSLCHILNNSLSAILMNIYGSELNDVTMRNMMGDTMTWTALIIASAACAGLLWYFWKKVPSKTWQTEEGELPPPPPAVADIEA